jgi:hypothetical protein
MNYLLHEKVELVVQRLHSTDAEARRFSGLENCLRQNPNMFRLVIQNEILKLLSVHVLGRTGLGWTPNSIYNKDVKNTCNSVIQRLVRFTRSSFRDHTFSVQTQQSTASTRRLPKSTKTTGVGGLEDNPGAIDVHVRNLPTTRLQPPPQAVALKRATMTVILSLPPCSLASVTRRSQAPLGSCSARRTAGLKCQLQPFRPDKSAQAAFTDLAFRHAARYRVGPVSLPFVLEPIFPLGSSNQKTWWVLPTPYAAFLTCATRYPAIPAMPSKVNECFA